MPAAPELIFRCVQPDNLPSAPTPATMSITAAGRSVPTVNSSARLQATRTGRPACLARIAASVEIPAACLPPKPPPVAGTMIRTSCSSSVSAAATWALTGNGVWVPVQTVSLPPSHAATAVLVSSAAGAM